MLMSLVCTAAVSFSGLLLRSLSCSALRVLLTFTCFCYFQKQTSAGKKNDNKTRKKNFTSDFFLHAATESKVPDNSVSFFIFV